MTIKEALDYVKGYKANDYIKSQVSTQGIKWLNTCDTEIYENIILTHEYNDGETEITFNGYDTLTPETTEMIVPVPYDDIYTFYLMAQIDYLNKEMTSYNNNMGNYKAKRDEFYSRYHTSHMPKQIGKIRYY